MTVIIYFTTGALRTMTMGEPGINWGPAGSLLLMLLPGVTPTNILEYVLLQPWQWWVKKKHSANLWIIENYPVKQLPLCHLPHSTSTENIQKGVKCMGIVSVWTCMPVPYWGDGQKNCNILTFQICAQQSSLHPTGRPLSNTNQRMGSWHLWSLLSSYEVCNYQ